jgi:formylglycine-generating enzyme required for sulfatase activity
MFCNNCNVDFQEGLRYCKWCGEALVDRPRITSELIACPACATAVQPGWTFCKACGAKLPTTTPQPAEGPSCPRCGVAIAPGARRCLSCGQEITQELVFEDEQATTRAYVVIHCVSCGELLDPEASYCKSCGEAVGPPQEPPVPYTIMCAACRTHNHIGSTVCRICGAALPESPTVPFDSVAPPIDPDATPTTVIPKRVPDDLASPPSTTQGGPPGNTAAEFDTVVFQPNAPTQPPPAPLDSPAKTSPRLSRELSTEPMRGSDADTSAMPDPRTPTSRVDVDMSTSAIAGSKGTAPVDEDLLDEEESAAAGSRATRVDVEVFTDSGGLVAPLPPEESAAARIGRPTVAFQGDESITGFGESKDLPGVDAQPATPSGGLIETAPAGEATAPIGSGAPAPPAVAPVTSPIPPTAVLQEGASGSLASSTSPAAPAAQSNSLVKILSAAVVVLVLGASAFFAWYFIKGRHPSATQPAPQIESPAAPEPPPVPSEPPKPVVPENMVLVPAGVYIIGRDNGEFESPQHTVELAAFFIDRTEVTNAEYKKFVDATGARAPDDWSGGSPPAGRENFPVTDVNWQEAVSYATWAGKRLPTEAEWEAASRGPQGLMYPWGNTWRQDAANIGGSSVLAVGQFKDGASPFGALDMIGNVWEWTEDEAVPYPGSTNPLPDVIRPDVTYRIIRGGAYDVKEHRGASYRGFVDASIGYPKTGFRCAKSASK